MVGRLALPAACFLFVLNLREIAWVWELQFYYYERGSIYYTLPEEPVHGSLLFQM